MSEIFNIKRFWNYFRYDLKQNWNLYGLSAVVVSLLPLWVYMLISFFALLTRGSWGAGVEYEVYQTMAMAILPVAVILSYPTKVYGNWTDKKAGSAALMIPVSTFEKFISMILISLVLLPAVVAGIGFGSDALISALDSSYNEAFAPAMWKGGTVNFIFSELTLSLPLLFYCAWVVNMLVFLLGALVFKKAKPAKTILAVIVISCILAALVASCAGRLDPGCSIDQFDTARLVSQINCVMNVGFGVSAVLLAAAIYLRIKTLKH